MYKHMEEQREQEMTFVEVEVKQSDMKGTVVLEM